MSINATFLGQLISFFLFAWFTMRYVFPPILAAIEQRQHTIARGLEQAQEAQKRWTEVQDEIQAALKEAHKESQKILHDAQQQAQKMLKETQEQCQHEQAQIVERAQAEIARIEKGVERELMHKTAKIALQMTSALLHKEVQHETHAAMLETLLQQGVQEG